MYEHAQPLPCPPAPPYLVGTNARGPPSYLASALDDQCVFAGGVEALWGALAAHNTTAELHMYPNGRHGYGRCRGAGSDKNKGYRNKGGRNKLG